MGRPSKGERVRVVTNLPPDVAEELNALCYRRGMDRSDVLAEMVADALARPQPGDAGKVKPGKVGGAGKAPAPVASGAAPVGYVPTWAPGSRLKKR